MVRSASRLLHAHRRNKRISRLSKFNRRACKLYTCNSSPLSFYSSYFSLSSTMLARARRSAAAALPITVVGRCLTMSIAVFLGQETDPAVAAPLNTITAAFRWIIGANSSVSAASPHTHASLNTPTPPPVNTTPFEILTENHKEYLWTSPNVAHPRFTPALRSMTLRLQRFPAAADALQGCITRAVGQDASCRAAQ